MASLGFQINPKTAFRLLGCAFSTSMTLWKRELASAMLETEERLVAGLTTDDIFELLAACFPLGRSSNRVLEAVSNCRQRIAIDLRLRN